jgi:SAM-dependent methyltransferase
MRVILARIGRRAQDIHVAPGPFAPARRWYAALRESAARLRAPGFVDVRALMREASLQEHVTKADAYFAGAGWNTVHARKPFADPLEAEGLVRALYVLFPNLGLFPGARLLDFGAGTCWSSLIFGYLGCDVVATDVSQNALRFGEERVRTDPVGKTLPISFLPFDGRRLALDDASVDRVVSIDALHHVPDIPATLAELGRVLRPGGIAAFSEPGPLHSLGAQSQFEMRTHGIIENDIRIEEIERSARAAGFDAMKVAWFAPHAVLLDVGEFRRLTGGRAGARRARALVGRTTRDLANVRVFFLYKSGARTTTSRSREGLVAQLAADLRFDGERLRGTVSATNAGRATWLPSGSGVGEVNVGVQLRLADGTLRQDHAHLPLSSLPVAPGETARASVDVAAPRGAVATIDLVAEGVAWFSSLGGATVSIPLV